MVLVLLLLLLLQLTSCFVLMGLGTDTCFRTVTGELLVDCHVKLLLVVCGARIVVDRGVAAGSIFAVRIFISVSI